MACFSNCRYNNFGPYYPCNVTTCGCNCSANNVVNPQVVQSYAFLALTTTTNVASGALVPVALVASSGTGITSATAGEVTLTPGTYQAFYNVTSEIGENGTNSFALSLDGTIIGNSVSSVSGTAGQTGALSNSVIFTVASNGTLRLVNNGEDAVDVIVANLTVRRIN